MRSSLLLASEEISLHQENPKILSSWIFLAMMQLKIHPTCACSFTSLFSKMRREEDEMPSVDDPVVL